MSVNMCAATGAVIVSHWVGFDWCGNLPAATPADAAAAPCQSNGAVDDVADAVVSALRLPFVLFFQHVVSSVVVVVDVRSPVAGRRQWNQQPPPVASV